MRKSTVKEDYLHYNIYISKLINSESCDKTARLLIIARLKFYINPLRTSFLASESKLRGDFSRGEMIANESDQNEKINVGISQTRDV